ncbi:MAG: hypothetical protein KBA66_08525 [Leptospiraceae bacterium]|nr:hypothetical protein [Leptospiraceae bacterium]
MNFAIYVFWANICNVSAGNTVRASQRLPPMDTDKKNDKRYDGFYFGFGIE